MKIKWSKHSDERRKTRSGKDKDLATQDIWWNFEKHLYTKPGGQEFLVVGEIGKYVISRDGTIITYIHKSRITNHKKEKERWQKSKRKKANDHDMSKFCRLIY